MVCGVVALVVSIPRTHRVLLFLTLYFQNHHATGSKHITALEDDTPGANDSNQRLLIF